MRHKQEHTKFCVELTKPNFLLHHPFRITNLTSLLLPPPPPPPPPSPPLLSSPPPPSPPPPHHHYCCCYNSTITETYYLSTDLVYVTSARLNLGSHYGHVCTCQLINNTSHKVWTRVCNIHFTRLLQSITVSIKAKVKFSYRIIPFIQGPIIWES